MEAQEPPILICQKTVLRLVSIGSRETLDRWVRNGVFPAPIRIGRQLRWLRAEVMDWIERRANTRLGSSRTTTEVQPRHRRQVQKRARRNGGPDLFGPELGSGQ